MIPILVATQGTLGTTSKASARVTITIPEKTKQTTNEQGEPEMESINGEAEFTTTKIDEIKSGNQVIQVFVLEPN